MDTFNITPKVDETQEFIEIANDFSNPLDLVREAISNAYDAKATEIKIIFEVIEEYGESILKITLKDNGSGMDKDGLQSFFDLGNSLRRNEADTIGEKGHGTKVYFNSKKIEVITSNSGNTLNAIMLEPFIKLHKREIPTVEVIATKENEIGSGTHIFISEYNNNRYSKFTHKILKDYILWFTKHGSIEKQFSDQCQDVKLVLKGLDVKNEEIIMNGHYFPKNSDNINKLFDNYLTTAPDYYCKKIENSGQLKNFPYIKYQAIFAIEGKYVKYGYNDMLRHQGYSAPEGAYTIQERYGLWLCKDFIPIQRKNEWITYRGSEYTKFHAFFNCQSFKLTANRGSIENTPSEILQDIQLEVKNIYDGIISSDYWRDIEWLENESRAHISTQREKNNFEWRKNKINKANVTEYNGINLVEPERESGVYSLFLLLSTVNPELFPFQIIDYDTHDGIDVIAKGDKRTPIQSAKLFYVEFKQLLSKEFNHSFANLHSVVCWKTAIKHDDIITDINSEQRKMQIIAPIDDSDYTRYYLDNPQKAHKIEVYVLKQFLNEKLHIDFKPRTSVAII